MYILYILYVQFFTCPRVLNKTNSLGEGFVSFCGNGELFPCSSVEAGLPLRPELPVSATRGMQKKGPKKD